MTKKDLKKLGYPDEYFEYLKDDIKNMDEYEIEQEFYPWCIDELHPRNGFLGNKMVFIECSLFIIYTIIELEKGSILSILDELSSFVDRLESEIKKENV